MEETNRKVLRGAAIVWGVLGLVLMATGISSGGFFFLLALVYWMRSTARGEYWTSENPPLARWAIVGLTALVLLLVATVAVLFLIGR